MPGITKKQIGAFYDRLTAKQRREAFQNMADALYVAETIQYREEDNEIYWEGNGEPICKLD